MPARVTVEPLGRHHDRTFFSCGVPALDEYLRNRASQDQQRKVAACYVAVKPADAGRVMGYYTLSNYGIRLRELPDDVTRRLPKYPVVPAALLGRLAVDNASQGAGLGEFLLMDALARTLRLSDEIAIHAVVVDAPDAKAASFYARYEFMPLPSEPLRLYRPLATVARAFG